MVHSIVVRGRKSSGTAMRTLSPVASMKSLDGKSSRSAVSHRRPSGALSTTCPFHRAAVHHE